MRVAIVGAGISGLGAARVLAEEGHDMSPYRKSGRLAELLGAYTMADYDGLIDDYKARPSRPPRLPAEAIN
jgi:uncharacterized protein with NAD-binding domain and iron-sulfur cluster